MSFLAQPEVLPTLVALAVWCLVWSRGYLSRAAQPKWLAADGALFSGALLANLALTATAEPLFQVLLVALVSLLGISLLGRFFVVRALAVRAAERG